MLEEIMKAAGIEVFGVADYNETLPGTGFKQRELFDGIQSVIVCLIPWDTGMNEGRNMARYAVGRNYHDVAAEHLSVATEILKRAFPDETFKFFVDSSPVAEVRAAVLAGLGVRGKNNLLISKEYGTRCAIGEIITTRKFAKSKKSVGTCFDCGKCIRECPNGALSDKGYDREKCVAYINQMKKELTPEDEALIKKVGFICGCDCCTDCCPMNRHADGTGMKEFKESAKPVYTPGMDLSDRSYGWKPANVERNYKIITED
ncbi:MAG: epoxyqueuosine reductase [Oscillospiraceae bacterium]|nr:epoxyqueuosine reductase [Oscillospiraceae bacterium]